MRASHELEFDGRPDSRLRAARERAARPDVADDAGALVRHAAVNAGEVEAGFRTNRMEVRQRASARVVGHLDFDRRQFVEQRLAHGRADRVELSESALSVD